MRNYGTIRNDSTVLKLNISGDGAQGGRDYEVAALSQLNNDLIQGFNGWEIVNTFSKAKLVSADRLFAVPSLFHRAPCAHPSKRRRYFLSRVG